MVIKMLLRKRRAALIICLITLICLSVHIWLLSTGTMLNSTLEVGIIALFLGKQNVITKQDVIQKHAGYENSEEKKNTLGNLLHRTPPLRHINMTKASKNRVKPPRKSFAKQFCNIPRLNPWHKDVRPFITQEWRNGKCIMRQLGKVENGVLKLSLPNVQRAGYYYFRRRNEDTNEYSDWHSLRETQDDMLQKGKFFLTFKVLNYQHVFEISTYQSHSNVAIKNKIEIERQYRNNCKIEIKHFLK